MDATPDLITEDFPSEPRPAYPRGRSRRKMSFVQRAMFEIVDLWHVFRFETLLQFALLVTGIVYAGLTYSMWTATREMTDQIRRQAVDLQRPWMSVSSIALAEPLTAGRPVRAVVTVKNTGQSPAMGIVLSTAMAIRDADPAFVRRLIGRNEPRTDLASDDVIKTSVDLDESRPLQGSDMAAIDSGRQRLYATVEIAYGDAFAHAASTRVCTVYRPADKEFGPCGIGNELK